jgi:AMP nucleosidase
VTEASIPQSLLTLEEARDFTACKTPQAALLLIIKLYDESLVLIGQDFERYAKGLPTEKRNDATYPFLAVEVLPGHTVETSTLSFGKISSPGIYGSTIAAPRLFRSYLKEQMELLVENCDAKLYVGRSTSPIPLTFALEKATAALTPEQRQGIQQSFHMPDLIETNNAVVDGTFTPKPGQARPLTLFSAERVDYSLHRLRHYTATDPQYCQRFVIFTNYQRYVDEFIEYGLGEVEAGTYDCFVEPGNRTSRKGAPSTAPKLAKSPQMPAYHLVRSERFGITLINIGVGPSNAKTITDHLAVMRPHVWLMVGHCGGLRASQRLGDYVLAHAYLRDDHSLDEVLPTEIPIPTIAEVQLALTGAVGEVTSLSGRDMKQRLRTGTVVTTDDRNWELRFDQLAVRFNQSRAIGIDMESATIAANGYRYRVPYGTLLCVSDRPLHGEIKLPGMADIFYEESVSQHLQIGIQAIDRLRDEATAGTLHSRKLRSFDEPAFR